jgi:hypothetical protein
MRRSRRILILLVVLALVAGVSLWERLWVRSWARPLEVAIYPIAVDAAAADHVGRLTGEAFEDIGAFFVREAARRQRRHPAPRLVLHAPLTVPPPLAQARSALEAIQWTLRLRWYAYRNTPFWRSLGKVRLFVLYHEPRPNLTLPHSHGLQKGLLGVVHVFATDEQQAQNNVVIAHELLHTLGATDKYDANGQPRYPEGYGDYTAEPRHPQDKAEIMAGRIAISATQAEIPRDLGQTTIGYKTAAEIGW